MPQNYYEMDPPDQLAIMEGEAQNANALMAKGDLWTKAKEQLTTAREGFNTATKNIKPHWKDGAHDAFDASAEQTKLPLNTWVENFGTTDPGAPMRALAIEIPKAIEFVRTNTNEWNTLWYLQFDDMLGNAVEKMEQLKRDNGRRMSDLDVLYQEARTQVEKNGSGPPFKGLTPEALTEVNTQEKKPGGPGGPGGQTPTGQSPTGQQPGGEQPGGEQPGGEQPGGEQPGGEQPGGEQPGGEQPGGGEQPPGGGGAEPPTGEMPGGGEEMPEIPQPELPDPSLSGGLGNAPTVPPNISTPPPTPHLPGGGPSIGGGGGGGIGGFGGGIGGAGGGAAAAKLPAGLRNPGVTPPAGFAPTVAGLPGTASGAPAGGAGGMPMMPPMGGMGAVGGGAGGGPPGSGAAQRTATGRGKRRDDGRTPGLPAMLGGRATTHTDQARTETSRASDAPTTTNVIDEDLWQVSGQRQTRHLGY